VKAGDEILFAVDPDGNDSYDGGRLSVKISAVSEPDPDQDVDKTGLKSSIDAAKALNQSDYTEASWANLAEALKKAEAVYQNADATQQEVNSAKQALDNAVSALEKKPAEPDPDRTNNANLKDDFSDTQGNNGWYYGAADWDGANFTELSWNGEAYKNGDGKPELKGDFVEPGGGRNAAYKWVAAQAGTIRVTGDYTKFAYDEAGTTGTCFRIRLNGEEKKFIGMNQADAAEERSESFDLTLEVKAGDELVFLVDPEGNDAWDGGRITASITAQ
jgi:hypothetical protein